MDVSSSPLKLVLTQTQSRGASLSFSSFPREDQFPSPTEPEVESLVLRKAPPQPYQVAGNGVK